MVSPLHSFKKMFSRPNSAAAAALRLIAPCSKRNASSATKDIESIQVVQSALKSLEAQEQLVSNWWTSYATSESIGTSLEKKKFTEAVKACTLHVEDFLEKNYPNKVDESTDPRYVSSKLRWMLAKFNCIDLERYFELLDKDKDGKIASECIPNALQVYINGSHKEWMQHQFDIFDVDQDKKLTKEQYNQMYMNMIGVHKAFLKDVFTHHVQHMSKKHVRQLNRSFVDTDWNEKVLEKVRCVWHFALDKPSSKESPSLLTFDQLYSSQQKEFAEFEHLASTYVDGFRKSRTAFYDNRLERRRTMGLGALFTVAVGLADYFIKVY